jgi:hypothetical protein
MSLVDAAIVIFMPAADGTSPLLLRTRMLCGARPAHCASIEESADPAQLTESADPAQLTAPILHR